MNTQLTANSACHVSPIAARILLHFCWLLVRSCDFRGLFRLQCPSTPRTHSGRSRLTFVRSLGISQGSPTCMPSQSWTLKTLGTHGQLACASQTSSRQPGERRSATDATVPSTVYPNSNRCAPIGRRDAECIGLAFLLRAAVGSCSVWMPQESSKHSEPVVLPERNAWTTRDIRILQWTTVTGGMLDPP